MVVIRAWESPSGEGSECFTFGKRSMGYSWVTGLIDYNSIWVLVHDMGGVLRVRLPLHTTAIEYGYAH